MREVINEKLAFWFHVSLFFGLVAVLFGCNHSSYGADRQVESHVGIVFDIGGKDDRRLMQQRLRE